MTECDFTLSLDGIADLTTDVEDAFFEAGCDDATVSMQRGRVYLRFTREATSFRDAVISAVKNVRDANIGAIVLRVDHCNLVTQAEIARRIGCSRQLVNQYIKGTRGPGKFPPPICDLYENTPLWYWCDVALWLLDAKIIEEEDYREAQDVTVINSVLELEHQRRLSPDPTKEIMSRLSICSGE